MNVLVNIIIPIWWTVIRILRYNNVDELYFDKEFDDISHTGILFLIIIYTKNKRSGAIAKVDNSEGSKVEIMICDVQSYLCAMHYMLAFNTCDDIITYWDSRTITKCSRVWTIIGIIRMIMVIVGTKYIPIQILKNKCKVRMLDDTEYNVINVNLLYRNY